MGHHMIPLFGDEEFSELLEKGGVGIHSDVKSDHETNLALVLNEDDENVKTYEVSKNHLCSTCQLEFSCVEEQREHFKLDLHACNVKQRMSGLSPLTAEEFILLDEDWTVNTETESSSEESSNEVDSESKDSDIPVAPSGKGAKMYFTSSTGKYFGIFHCLLFKNKERPTSNEILKSVQECHKKPFWIILMTGGGHFAGAVFNGANVVQHKTLHSYSIRSKQGSSQSKKDAQGRHPKSAGASLRRYNEESFAQHVLEILQSWKKHFGVSHLILFRAVGHNQKLFFGDQSPLKKNDSRVRNIPIPTRKATFKEVKRVHEILSTVEVFDSLEIYERKTLIGSEPSTPKEREKKTFIDRAKARKSPTRPLPVSHVSESSADEGGEVVLSTEMKKLSMREELEEYRDTVPTKRKKRKTTRRSRARKVRIEEAAGKSTFKNEPESSIVKNKDQKGDTTSGSDCSKVLAAVKTASAPKECNNGSLELADNAQAVIIQDPGSPKQVLESVTLPTSPSTEMKEMETGEAAGEAQLIKRKRRYRKRKPKIDKDEQVRGVEEPPEEEEEEAPEEVEKAPEGKGQAGGITTVFKPCCQCHQDLSGKIPFEYSQFKFCSIGCLKSHRMNLRAVKK